MKTTTFFSAFLFLIVLSSACQRTNKELIIGKWSFIGFNLLDTTSMKDDGGIAAIAWLNLMTNGGAIEFYENGDYEMKKEPTYIEKGKYSISKNSIVITKLDGSNENDTLNFKNNNELEIKSSTMKLLLKRN